MEQHMNHAFMALMDKKKLDNKLNLLFTDLSIMQDKWDAIFPTRRQYHHLLVALQGQLIQEVPFHLLVQENQENLSSTEKHKRKT